MPDSFEAKNGHVKKTIKPEFLEPLPKNIENLCQIVPIYTVLSGLRAEKKPKRREFTSYLQRPKTTNFLTVWSAFTHLSDQKIAFQGQSRPAWTTSKVRIFRFSMPRVVNFGLYDPAAAPEHVNSELTSLAAAPEHLNSQLYGPAAATMCINPGLYGPAAPPEYANSQLSYRALSTGRAHLAGASPFAKRHHLAHNFRTLGRHLGNTLSIKFISLQNAQIEPSQDSFAHICGQAVKMLKSSLLRTVLSISAARPSKCSN